MAVCYAAPGHAQIYEMVYVAAILAQDHWAQVSIGGASTEHAESEVGADDACAAALRSSFQVAAGSMATEHARAEFCLEGAMAETLQCIKAISGDTAILVRVVDHACHSEQCVSHRVVAMCRAAKWKTSLAIPSRHFIMRQTLFGVHAQVSL